MNGIEPHIIQLESITLDQMDIDKSHTRIRLKPLHVDLAINSHKPGRMNIHALLPPSNVDPPWALTANRCYRLAMLSHYSRPIY